MNHLPILSIITFLGINGHDLDATDAEVISEMLALADGRVSEEELAGWIRQHTGRQRRRRPLGKRSS